LSLGAILDEHAITFMSSVPPVWRIALKASRPPRSGTLKRVFCGSAPLSAVLWRGIQDWAGTRDVCNAYGITETGSWVAGTTVPTFVPEDGLIGVPWGATISVLRAAGTAGMPGSAAVCETGESGYVWINTPALMQGYLGRDDLTQAVVANGWFCTGDIGLIDERGFLYLRGREREEINKGGLKVYPGDVDAVAEEFADTLDVCAFGYEDPLQGQDVGIALVLKQGDASTLSRLHELMAQRLATYQMPRRWYLLQEIPRTSRGKVNRARVAEVCQGLEPVNLRAISGRGDHAS
jgi:acyl-CoA synthetase (AMP-forming)/AMP-acid ligase II